MRLTLAAVAAAASLLLGVPQTASAVIIPPPAAATGPCGRLAKPPVYKHVIWVWLENKSYSKIIGSPQAPYLNSLAAGCGLATNYHNVTHPSLPNYIAATSGLGYANLSKEDCDPKKCATTAPSIFGQGETWRAYEQSMPSSCYPLSQGNYAVRHNPPPYYPRVAGCGTRDVTYSHLAGDLSQGRLAAFSFITPNLIDDMHDGSVAQGDAWLAQQLPKIFASPQYRDNSTAVFITWDEGTDGSVTKCASNTTDVGCHVATLVISPSTPAGTRSGALFSHYSLLGTTEHLLGLRRLGLAATARLMTSAFHL